MNIMNKRAASWMFLQTITIIAGIVAAFVVVFIFLRVNSPERADNSFLAKDAAMLVDALLSTPQDVQLVYPKEFEKGYIQLNNHSVSVFPSQPEQNKSSFLSHYIIPRKDVRIIEGDVELSVLFFIKENNTLMLDTKPAMAVVEEGEE